MTPVVVRRLPVGLAVKRAFLYAWESRSIFARPYAIYAAITIAADLLLLAVAGHRSKAAEFAVTGAEELLALAFAVGISRYVLLGETPFGFHFFRFDRNLVHYVRITFLLLIVNILAWLPALMVLGSPGAPGDAGSQRFAAMVALAIMVMAAIIISRLMLALPAAALGERVPARTIWDATRGNGGRIFLTLLLAWLPFLAIQLLLILSIPTPPADAAALSPVTPMELVAKVVDGLISPAQIIVCTITVSLCYDVLMRGGGPPAK